jgi:tetratricopeptide (TPR) repeat protein
MMKTIFIIIFFTYSLVLLCDNASAASTAKNVKEGNRLYKQEKYGEAADKYSQAKEESPDSDIVNFNLGAALYKEGKYEEALDAITGALSTDDKKLEAQAVYNLANTTYKLGSEMAQTDMNSAINMYRQSLDYFKRAMELDSSDQDAKYNHELVERNLKILLDQLKNQQQQQDQNEDQEGGQENRQSQSKSESQKEGEEQQEQKQEGQESGKEEAGAEKDRSQPSVQEEEEKTQASEAHEDESKEMSPEEARILLDAYGQEEAREDLRKRGRATGRGVLRDW